MSTSPHFLPSTAMHLLRIFLVLWGVAGVHAQSSPVNSGPNTSLAMIILYAITGCVSALFCVVIVSGAIRAIRHPERYGPRTADGGFGGGVTQSRARGLTRAILDTFPVVKFGGDPANADPRPKDVENPGGDIEMADHTKSDHDAGKKEETGAELQTWEVVDGPDDKQVSRNSAKLGDIREEGQDVDDGGEDEERDVVDEGKDESSGAGSSKAEAVPAVRPRLRPGRSEGEPSGDMNGEKAHKEVVPDAIGRETCPICIVDFEEGDDLRVLPCEGHHRFHRDCVDQWLLELSSSCPICRQDFHALETMMAAGDAGDHLEPPHMPGMVRPLSTAAARFSRYLRVARRRHHHSREDGSGYDITDPPMLFSPEMRF